MVYLYILNSYYFIYFNYFKVLGIVVFLLLYVLFEIERELDKGNKIGERKLMIRKVDGRKVKDMIIGKKKIKIVE